jgi:hypothetical protein
MEKTMELMNETKTPKVKIKKINKSPEASADSKENDSTTSGYSWVEDDLYGWTYSSRAEINIELDKWVYLQNLGWVWSPSFNKSFIYSYIYGWIYVKRYLNYRVGYLYDRRIWNLLSNLK